VVPGNSAEQRTACCEVEGREFLAGSANQKGAAMRQGWQMNGRRGCRGAAVACPNMQLRGMQRHDGVQARNGASKTNADGPEAGALRSPAWVATETSWRVLAAVSPTREGPMMPDDETCDMSNPPRGSYRQECLTPLGKRRQRPARRRAGAGRELRRALRRHHGGVD
jgi:hypothetical protein